MIAEPYKVFATTIDSPAVGAVEVTPDDEEMLEVACRALYIGSEGDVSVVMRDNSEVVFVGLLAGSILPVRCKRVNATGTTAADIVALY